MSSFTNKLTVTDLGKGLWRVEKGFRYYIGDEGSDDFVDVPDGFITDFFSIPLPFRWILPKTQHGNQSSALHDFLYNKFGKMPDKTYTRAECDKIFLEAMQVLGVSLIKRRIMYRAVRLGGWAGWRTHAYRWEKANAKDN